MWQIIGAKPKMSKNPRDVSLRKFYFHGLFEKYLCIVYTFENACNIFQPQ